MELSGGEENDDVGGSIDDGEDDESNDDQMRDILIEWIPRSQEHNVL